MTVRPLGRTLGGKVPSRLSGAAGLLSQQEAAGTGPDTSPAGRATGLTGRICNRALHSPLGTTALAGPWADTAPCHSAMRVLRGLQPLALNERTPQWVLVEPLRASGKLTRSLLLGKSMS